MSMFIKNGENVTARLLNETLRVSPFFGENPNYYVVLCIVYCSLCIMYCVLCIMYYEIVL